MPFTRIDEGLVKVRAILRYPLVLPAAIPALSLQTAIEPVGFATGPGRTSFVQTHLQVDTLPPS